MKKITAPNGDQITIPDGRVITFGLSEEENDQVKGALPAKGYELLDTDAATDLIAISAAALIVNAPALDSDSREMLLEYYVEIGGNADETVFWLGNPKPPRPLRAKFKCYESFDEIAPNLKYHLLSAHSKSRKTQDFSKKIADCLQILAIIRAHPYIRTQQISEEMELPMRTVQRYIATLQATGEWLEYDTTSRGWYLQNGISMLFGDVKTGDVNGKEQ